MDERDVVELSLRLPAGELGQLARLMEQVRGLLAMEGSGKTVPSPASPPSESGVNTAFDAALFQRLEEAESASAGERPALDFLVERSAPDGGAADLVIPTAEVPAETALVEAVSAGGEVRENPEAPPTEAEVSAELEIPAVEAEAPQNLETPAGTLEVAEETALEGPLVKPAEAEAALELPRPAVPEVRRNFEGAQSVGSAAEAEIPEARGGAFAALEELVDTGAAPLTAEAVALAFQRDDRRYDNGFPLY